MKSKKLISDLIEKVKVTRRSFIKGALAIGTASTVYGCSKEGIEILGGSGGGSSPGDPIAPVDLSNAQMYTTACGHNCGAGTRCMTNVHVVNNKIVRVTSDEDERDFNGILRDKNWLNDTRVLSCAKGRSAKFKVNSAVRVKYGLKQTKERGDVTGFIRMDTEAMMKEVATKVRSVYTKHGVGAIYIPKASASNYSGTFSTCWDAAYGLTKYVASTRGELNDWSYHQINFAGGLTGYMIPYNGSPYTPTIGSQLHNIAGAVKNAVSWGTNTLSTANTSAWGYIRAMEKLKERGGKHYFIGPEFVDTGVTCSTDWVQVRNYTDTALIMGMFHEMIVNTFNADGTLKPKEERWLDVAYLDTMVYGFFDSPDYWLHIGVRKVVEGNVVIVPEVPSTGEIVFVEPATKLNEWRYINSVPSGRSLSAYVMGSDDRLTKATYDATGETATYTSNLFQSKQANRNGATCSYTATKGDATEYLYKKDFLTAKTPEWAEAICGTPAATIRALAKMYCDPAQHPIYNDWAVGMQKQNNGVINIIAITALMCVTKTFGLKGEGLFSSWASYPAKWGKYAPAGSTLVKDIPIDANDPDSDTRDHSIPEHRPSITSGKSNQVGWIASLSVKEWFNSLKMAHFDELKDKLGADINKHIPEWNPDKDRYINDNGGAKAGIKYIYAPNAASGKEPLTYTDTIDNLEYYDYVGRNDNTTGVDSTPEYNGIRVIVNPGGGIPLNQSMNANDTALVYKTLEVSGDPTDPDRFCLVTFDPFFSPGAKYSDYLFPATVHLEAGDWTSIASHTVYRPAIVKAPGAVKDGWRYAYEALKAQAELGSFMKISTANNHFKYVGTSNRYQPADVLSLKLVDDAIANPDSKFYGMTRNEVYANQAIARAPATTKEHIATTESLVDDWHGWAGSTRIIIDEYLALDPARRVTTPFIRVGGSADDGYTYITSEKSRSLDPDEAYHVAGGLDDRPVMSHRFSVYLNAVVWDYERKYSKWHGWLPKEKRGQTNKDHEGDTIVYPIPMYFNFEDSFNEAYGVFNGKPENNVIGKNLLTLGTTHDRYRVHSSNSTNAFLRELTTRTDKGKWLSGNDWNEYATIPDRHPEGGTAPISPMLSSAVYKADPTTASWQEIWMNIDDANDRTIKDGDLVLVKNPIGAVRCVARTTNRCVRGTANLHQGAWYDPNPIDGVDDGACVNTLMSYHPSRIDQGNAQQSAYVSIEKTTPPAAKQ